MRTRTLASLLITRQLFLLASVLVVIGISQWLILRNVLYQTVAHTLNGSAGVLESFAHHILRQNRRSRLASPGLPSLSNHSGHDILSRLKAPGTEIVVANAHQHVILRSPDIPKTASPTPSSSFYLWHGRIVITETLTHGKHLLGYLWVMSSVSSMNHILVSDTGIFGAVSLLVIVLFAAMGVWSVRSALNPLRPVVAATLRIAGGEWGRTVPIPDQPEELKELSRAVNTLSVRIEEAFTKERTLADQMRRFVADASHELRTPLTALTGFLGLLDAGDLTPQETTQGLRAMRRESQRMARMVNQLLSLSRLDSPMETDFQVSVIPLNQWLKDVRPTLESLCQDHPLLLSFSDEPLHIIFDSDRLSEILFNLIENACRHTPAGTPIHVEMGRTGGEPWLAVRDEGPGFLPGSLPLVFHRFYRGDQSRSGGGSGLGLSITQSLMEALGGRAEARNVPPPGRGAVVCLFFKGTERA